MRASFLPVLLRLLAPPLSANRLLSYRVGPESASTTTAFFAPLGIVA